MPSPRPRVTIGVPVYNGEALLRQCLECLAGQTSGEATILIMDNASSDRTSEIAHDFAARDRRFRVLRQPSTVDVRQNFADVLAAADTEYFAWRAYDDLSDPDWVEKLTALLDANPWANLAVGRIVTMRRDQTVARRRAGPTCTPQDGWRELRALALSAFPAWMYGLYRRADILRVFARCRELHGYVWSLDILVLLTFILSRRLVGTDETTFQAFATGRSQTYLMPNHYLDSWAVWYSFYRAATTILRESGLTPRERYALQPTMFQLANQRSEKLRRIVRGALGAWLLGGDGHVRAGPVVRITASQ